MKQAEPMGLKTGEIVALVIALALPVAFFILLLIPGAMEAIVRFLLNRQSLIIIPTGLAVALAGIVGVRVWNRTRRPKNKPKDEDRPPTFWDFWRDPYR